MTPTTLPDSAAPVTVVRTAAHESTFSLGPAEQIPYGEGRTFRVGERSVAVFRTRDGELHAVQAECPHRRGPLADGFTGGGVLICPMHGYRFSLVTGAAQGHGCGDLEVFPVRVNGRGEILVRLP